MNETLRIILIILLIVLLVLLLLSFALSGFVYYATFTRQKHPADLNANDPSGHYAQIIKEQSSWLLEQNLEDVTIVTKNNMQQKAFFFPAKEPTNRTILFVHGWTSDGPRDYALAGTFYHDAGYNMLLIDQQAHGRSDGKVIGFGTIDHHNLLSWINYLDKRYLGDGEIFIHGLSMGANTVALVADHELPKSVKGLILDCGYTTVFDELVYLFKTKIHLPIFPFVYQIELFSRIFGKYSFKECSSVKSLKNARVPVLFIHGDMDRMVPLYMSKRGYEACASEKEILIVQGSTHATSHTDQPEIYEKTVFSFIEKYSN